MLLPFELLTSSPPRARGMRIRYHALNFHSLGRSVVAINYYTFLYYTIDTTDIRLAYRAKSSHYLSDSSYGLESGSSIRRK
jgi:hypothetical protein